MLLDHSGIPQVGHWPAKQTTWTTFHHCDLLYGCASAILLTVLGTSFSYFDELNTITFLWTRRRRRKKIGHGQIKPQFTRAAAATLVQWLPKIHSVSKLESAKLVEFWFEHGIKYSVYKYFNFQELFPIQNTPKMKCPRLTVS